MPQLNPEFFISQLFWLVISFTFLFIFLWRISLPRISTVLEKRSNKINEDIAVPISNLTILLTNLNSLSKKYNISMDYLS